MIRAVALTGFLAALPFVAGCGTDPRRMVLSEIKASMDQASSKLVGIKETLKKASDDFEKGLKEADDHKAKGKDLDADTAKKKARTKFSLDIDGLQKESLKMREIGQAITRLKGQAEILKGKMTPEEREAAAKELGEEFRPELNGVNKRLKDNYQDLLKEWVRADTLANDATLQKKLWEAIRDAQDEFAAIARQK